jgi:hypothetical protein
MFFYDYRNYMAVVEKQLVNGQWDEELLKITNFNTIAAVKTENT